MSRYFVGSDYANPARSDVQIQVDGERYSFKHRVGGSYVDFQWDGGGPGSTDLARALLTEVTGAEPEWRIYRLFKNEVVATWPHHEGECWRLSEDEVRQWLAEVETDTVRTENAGQTEARLAQTVAREGRLKFFSPERGQSGSPWGLPGKRSGSRATAD
mgnify:CR=1 FL=1